MLDVDLAIDNLFTFHSVHLKLSLSVIIGMLRSIINYVRK